MPTPAIVRSLAVLAGLSSVLTAMDPLDCLAFGNPASEQAHHLTADGSEIIVGGLNDPARRLLPKGDKDWRGGTLAFTLTVDPKKQNYVTVRFWGDEITHNRLFLICDGKQIGYRHLGDIDQLDFGTDAPVCLGRFYYTTCPLPLALTTGKTSLPFEIRSTGPIWGYGTTFEKYQKPMAEPTRGIYRAYVHTDGCFVPPTDDKQGKDPDMRLRPDDGRELMDAIKPRVIHYVDGLINGTKPLNQPQLEFLARAYRVTWTPACNNPTVIMRVVESLDHLLVTFQHNPKIAESDPATPNPDWFGLGLAGDAVRRLLPQLTPYLDQTVDKAGGVTRRAGYTAMLMASRDWHTRHRRLYTNQSMINDLYGIYLSHRGVAALDPTKAWPEQKALRYLYESVGLEPWLGSEDEAGVPCKPLGDDFFQVTPKGLTRELGFVGNYGEVIDWVTCIYKATCDEHMPDGDPRLKAQLRTIVLARAPFRYGLLDQDGYYAMTQETVVGWRDVHLPGNITYVQRPSRDASPIEAAAALKDPHINGMVQQMFAEHQFFPGVRQAMEEKTPRATMGLLAIPDDLATTQAQPASPTRMPMTPSSPDFVFSDEVDGVVAVKHGHEILYVSLYWRARYAVNFLARVHHITPTFDRIAVVQQQTEFTPSGMTYKRPDWTNMAFGNGGVRYDDNTPSAHAGEILPIAKIPDFIAKFDPGTENLYAGRGDFYVLRYGQYVIAMNMTKDRSFKLPWPTPTTRITAFTELVSGQKFRPGTMTVKPMSTIVQIIPPEPTP